MVNPIGIIQGRLTPSGGKLQFFPDISWKEEFSIASVIGLDFIELISDLKFNKQNPLWTGEGVEILKRKTQGTRAGPVSVTIDHIMDRPITDDCEGVVDSLNDLKNIVNRAQEIGVKTVVLPFLEKASVKNAPEKIAKIPEIINSLIESSNKGVVFAMESDLSAEEQLGIFGKVNNRNFGICYDTGNRMYFGFDVTSEILELGSAIVHVHIKDKNIEGKNVMLGTGCVPFYKVMKSFKEIQYKGPFTMETCRGDSEIEAAMINLSFIRGLL
jgi:sugar phosphate isomerase/epimerase